MTELTYTYIKQRKEFGGPYKFSDKDELIVDIAPNPDLCEGIRILETVDKSVDIVKEMSEHEVRFTYFSVVFIYQLKYMCCGLLHIS